MKPLPWVLEENPGEKYRITVDSASNTGKPIEEKLQAFPLGPPPYGPAETKTENRATENCGSKPGFSGTPHSVLPGSAAAVRFSFLHTATILLSYCLKREISSRVG